MTGGDPFKEDELMKWPALRFLNRLQYVKQKNEAEEFERSIKK